MGAETLNKKHVLFDECKMWQSIFFWVFKVRWKLCWKVKRLYLIAQVFPCSYLLSSSYITHLAKSFFWKWNLRSKTLVQNVSRWTNNLLFPVYHINLLWSVLQDVYYSMLTLLMLLAMYGSWGTRITSISLIQWLAAVITISRGRGSRVQQYLDKKWHPDISFETKFLNK